MTQKRSDYRKKQAHARSKGIWQKIEAAFTDDKQEQNLDVDPAFRRQEDPPRHSLAGDGEPTFSAPVADSKPSVDKGLRLKKRLNRAILIVLVLIILVLLALFHL